MYAKLIRIGAELSVTLRIFVTDMKLIVTIILSMSMFFGIESGIRGAEIHWPAGLIRPVFRRRRNSLA